MKAHLPVGKKIETKLDKLKAFAIAGDWTRRVRVHAPCPCETDVEHAKVPEARAKDYRCLQGEYKGHSGKLSPAWEAVTMSRSGSQLQALHDQGKVQ